MAIRLGQGFVDLFMKDDMLQKVADRVESRLNKLRKTFDLISGTAKWTFAGLTALAGLSAKSAMEAEDTWTKVNYAISKHGALVGMTLKQVQELSAKYQGLTRHGDEAVAEAVLLLGTFKQINASNLERVLKAAMDMAAFMGGDLQGSITLIGRLLEDPTHGMMMLSRQGVVLGDQLKDTVSRLYATGQAARAQDILLQALEERFGGMAQALGGNTKGSIIQLKEAIGDLMEAIGGTLLPAIQWLANSMKSLVNTVRPLVEQFPNLTKGVIAFGIAATGVAWVLPKLISGLAALRTVVLAFRLLNFAALLAPIAPYALLAAVAIGGLASAIGGLDGRGRSWTENMVNGFKRMFAWAIKLKDVLMGTDGKEFFKQIVKADGDKNKMPGKEEMPASLRIRQVLFGTQSMMNAYRERLQAERESQAAEQAAAAKNRPKSPIGRIFTWADNSIQDWQDSRKQGNSEALAKWWQGMAGGARARINAFGNGPEEKPFRSQAMSGIDLAKSMQADLLDNSAELERKRQEKERTEAAKKSAGNSDKQLDRTDKLIDVIKRMTVGAVLS